MSWYLDRQRTRQQRLILSAARRRPATPPPAAGGCASQAENAAPPRCSAAYKRRPRGGRSSCFLHSSDFSSTFGIERLGPGGERAEMSMTLCGSGSQEVRARLALDHDRKLENYSVNQICRFVFLSIHCYPIAFSKGGSAFYFG